MMKKSIVIFYVLLFITFPVFAQQQFVSFGPIITFSDKKVNNITILFYTQKSQRSQVIIKSDKKSFTLNGAKDKFHQYKVKTSNTGSITYKLLSAIPTLDGFTGKLELPKESGYRFAVYGNSAEGGENFGIHSELCNAIAKHKPYFVIHTGNIVIDSLNKELWSRFFKSGKSLFSTAAFLPVIGKYDFYSTVWRKIFDVSNKRYPFYSYYLPNMTLIVLNSGMYFSKDSMQYVWLVDELQKAKGKWKIVVFHHPPFSVQYEGTRELSYIRKYIIPLLEQYKTDLVLNGMDNYYERSYYNGITYITVGTSSGYTEAPKSGNPYSQKAVGQKNTFAIVEVTAQSLMVKAYDKDNRLIDEYMITK